MHAFGVQESPRDRSEPVSQETRHPALTADPVVLQLIHPDCRIRVPGIVLQLVDGIFHCSSPYYTLLFMNIDNQNLVSMTVYR